MTNQNAPADTMTIRQRFVMAAMQGLCASPEMTKQTATDIARWAVEQADAALAEEARTRAKALQEKGLLT